MARLKKEAIYASKEWKRLTPFTKRVLSLVEKISLGKLKSYGEIAEKIGNKNLARAVGQALKRNPFPGLIPCHRVIKSDGKLGGYLGGIEKKKLLLKKEGFKIIGEKVLKWPK